MEPLRDALNSKHTSPAVRGSLRVMAEGAWPFQATLHEGGLSDSPLCCACQESRGTFYHRVRECPAQHWCRKGQVASAAGVVGGSPSPEEEEADPLLRRGLAYRPPQARVPAMRYESVVGPAGRCDADLGFKFTGAAGSDGSMPVGKPTGARRAGWSAVSVSEDGTLAYAIFGSCPDRCPTAHRAELWAS